LGEVEAQHLTVRRGVRGNDDPMKKEMLPKSIVTSLLSAGSAVKNCRTVSIGFPGLLSCAISFGEKLRN